MTTFDSHICARLISDGTCVHVPEQMGTPRPDQLQGTVGEQLAELAGRVCYDSLGKGRDSESYHGHILQVRHLSVLEHVVFTVEIRPVDSAWLPAGVFERVLLLPTFLNRPGVFVRFDGTRALRITLNVRSALEWGDWMSPVSSPWESAIWHGIAQALEGVCPVIARLSGAVERAKVAADAELRAHTLERKHVLPRISVRVVDALLADEERWVTLLMTGSRGMSHELVRHGDFTAISQRSTRYVDESESPYVRHPLETAYRKSEGLSEKAIIDCGHGGYGSPGADQITYRNLVGDLEPWLIARGVDKLTARKQARGAARGYLGNALYTEVVFSASVAQWRRMLATGSSARCSNAADAEIRVLFAQALTELKHSRYADRFEDMTLVPAADGIGEVVALQDRAPASV